MNLDRVLSIFLTEGFPQRATTTRNESSLIGQLVVSSLNLCDRNWSNLFLKNDYDRKLILLNNKSQSEFFRLLWRLRADLSTR